MTIKKIQPFHIDATKDFVFGNLNADGAFQANSTANLGSVSNVKISGGTANYVLSTDGSGNLSWVAQSGGGGTPGGANTQIQFNDAGSFSGNANLTFDKTTSVLTVIGNVVATNADLGNLTTSNYFTGNGSLLSAITGANVTGEVAYATTSNSVAVANVTGIGNIATVNLDGNASNILYGNGSFAAAPVTYGNSNVATFLASFGSNTITTTGNVQVGNIIGNGQALTGLNGANVTGQVANALVAGTVYTNAQPNITSVGTLTDLNVSGNAVFGGNLTVDGNLVYVNVTDLSVEDPIIQLQTGPNAAAPTSNSGKDVGTALNYYDTSAKIAFMGWDVSNAEFGFGNTVSISGEVVTFTSYGNIRAGYFIGNGSQLTGITSAAYANYIANGTSNVNISTASGNVTVGVAGNANIITVTGTGANITGTLNATGNANVGNIGATNGVFTNVSGNGSALSSLTGANITGQVANALVAGTVYTAAQPNITSIGTLTGLTSNGTVNFTNASNVSLGAVGNLKITGGTANYVLQTDGTGNLSWVAQSGGGGSSSSIANGTSNVSIPVADGNINLSASGNANVVVVTGSGINVSGTITTSGSGGNLSGANYVIANYFSGSGNNLSNIQAANISGTVANSNYSLYAGTVLTNAQPNITSVGTLSSLTVTGNLSAGNANLGNLTTSNFFSGNGSLLSSLTGANITGQVANALVAGTVYTAAQPNITSVGLLTALSVGPNSSITLTGTSGYVKANSIQGTDGVNAIYPAYSGVTGAVGITGNLTVGIGIAANITANGNVTANYFIGNGSSLTSIAGANVTGQVANATVAGTVYTNAQPNITSVGTLSNLTSNGTINFTNASNVSLGAVGNVKITGGTANYVLSTDGSGNLSWVAQSGGGGGAANITIESEGNVLTSSVATIDFVGTGVTATNVGNVVTITIPAALPSTGSYSTRTYTGDGNAVSYTISNGLTVSSVIVALNGVLQTPTSDYTVSSNVLTFTSAPAANEAIQIRELGTPVGGSNTQIQFNDEGGFGGNANLTFDKTTGTLNAINITANGTPLATTGKAIAMAIVFGF